MKKIFLCLLLFITIGLTSCGNPDIRTGKVSSEPPYKDEITVMHIEAENDDFRNYIDEASHKLNIKINLIPCPSDANNRQAEVTTILASGNTAIDLISVNDEMVSEFKYKGYLEPLNDVMTKETLQAYPTDYIQSIATCKGNIFSVPYLMDIMMLWVNEKYLKVSGLKSIKNLDDFSVFLSQKYASNTYGYGSAWEETYIYNDLSQFINMFGGNYYDWNNPDTKAAVRFLHDMLKSGKTPGSQMIDRYEQMEQKFIDGKYGCVFMYSGAMNIFYNSGKYSENEIHIAKLPIFKKASTNIATWQYVLNKSSKNKAAAKRFLKYISGKDGSIAYSKAMKQIPARTDVILTEDISVPDLDIIRKYVRDIQLKARPLSSQPMRDISEMGNLLQKYLSDEITLSEFCNLAQSLTNLSQSNQ